MTTTDILQFNGHIAIYIGKSEEGKDLMWTASTSQQKYVIQSVSAFEKTKPLQGVYRYQIEEQN